VLIKECLTHCANVVPDGLVAFEAHDVGDFFLLQSVASQVS
jgi:hypothetical protein